MADVAIPLRIRRNWDISPLGIFRSKNKYSGHRIFKFAYDPTTKELLFDLKGIHHDMIILNNGKKTFNHYARGICFWDIRTIYLRGYEDKTVLEKTKAMLRENGVGKHIRIIWGPGAAEELEEELKGL